LKLVSLLIGNAGWLPGNLSLMPDAKLDDGLLDVAAVGPRRFWNWLDLWGRVVFANQNVRPNRIGRQLMDATANVKTIENLTGSKLRVTPDRPVHLQLDGDVLGMVSEAEFEIVPRAITVRV
jgi:diacylglycerol kinase family enzyme